MAMQVRHVQLHNWDVQVPDLIQIVLQKNVAALVIAVA